MHHLTHWFYRSFSWALALLLASGMVAEAQAKSAVRAWGEAMQRQYYETKKLGSRSTPAQRAAINKQSFSEANAAFNRETLKKQTQLGVTMTRLNRMVESEINSARKDKAIAKKKGMTLAQYRKSLKGQVGKDGKPLKPGESGAGSGAAGRGTSSLRNTGTGPVGAADGARNVDFGKKEKEQPNYKVIDGIIQE